MRGAVRKQVVRVDWDRSPPGGRRVVRVPVTTVGILLGRDCGAVHVAQSWGWDDVAISIPAADVRRIETIGHVEVNR